ncbi:hypothetical protein [Marinomonas sp. GJ51-6]|uniref:hypothetical protein n=1 Tax=Marinomonas sp. GJ51-6 TaxID=2992802 RepID=UPI002934C6D8|nr:hypothetical protein [Marinomonas sp. GJ51-6]WOD06225.1 hypothetical protein ONZ50_10815 [Marinomonas sp. GJ51-6]
MILGSVMYDCCFLVLLYNKEFCESDTLSTLLPCDNAKVVIWNNGSYPLKSKDVSSLEEMGLDVSFVETLHNESLSVIYNRFLNEYSAEKYVILDDDSSLNEEYLKSISEVKSDQVGMPIIQSHGRITSPRINRKLYSGGDSVIQETDKVSTIGSGLVIGCDVINKLIVKYGSVFDERFYFYGVDTTFCFRLFDSNLTKHIEIIPGFNHQLSRLEIEEDLLSDFRRLERSYDMGLTMRYYNYKSLGSNFNKVIKLGLKSVYSALFRKKTKILFFHFLRALVLGKHYKDLN